MNIVGIFGALFATHVWRERQNRIAERRRRAVASGWLDCIVIDHDSTVVALQAQRFQSQMQMPATLSRPTSGQALGPSAPAAAW